MAKKIYLVFPPGHGDIQVPKGLPEDPETIDWQHDRMSFTDLDGSGRLEIDAEIAKMIEPHLHHVPGVSIERK